METVTPIVELQSLIHLECQKGVKYIFRTLSLYCIGIVNMKVAAKTKLLADFEFVLKHHSKFDFAIIIAQAEGSCNAASEKRRRYRQISILDQMLPTSQKTYILRDD